MGRLFIFNLRGARQAVISGRMVELFAKRFNKEGSARSKRDKNQYVDAKVLLISGLCALFILTLSIAIDRQISRIEPPSIPVQSITVLELSDDNRLRRRRVSDPALTMAEQSILPRNAIRQYTYLFYLEPDELPPLRAVIPQINGTAQAYMNGVRISQNQTRNYMLLGQKPGYADFTISRSHFLAGNNRLEFIVTPDEWGASLSEVYLDSPKNLSPVVNRIKILGAVKPVWAMFAAFFGLTFIAGLFLKGSWRSYAPMAVMGASLLFKALLSPGANLPANLSAFAVIVVLDVAIFIAVVTIVYKRRNGKNENKSTSTLVALLEIFLTVLAILGPLITAFSIAPITQSLADAVRLVPFLPVMAFGSLPFFTYVSAQQLRTDYFRSRLSKKQLLGQLAEQEKIISDQRASLEQQIKKAAQMEERQRLTRDIHDGIGGHLLSLLVRVKSGDVSSTEVESELQDGLNDLRLIVDSMDHSADDLESALKTFRARARPQLIASDIALNWEFSDPFDPGRYGPKTVLSLYRFLQEAVSNTVRHSGATRLDIRLVCKAPSEPFLLYVADDGKGMEADAALRSGQGLKNMKSRAKALKATLKQDEGLGGKGVSFTLTLPSPT